MMNINGPGYISVAWIKPGCANPEIIPGKYPPPSPADTYQVREPSSAREFPTAGFYQLKGASDRYSENRGKSLPVEIGSR